MNLRPLLALVLALCASCATPWSSRFALSKPEQVPAAVAAAEADLEAGRTADALERAREARKVKGLDSATRDQVEVLLERVANRRIEELSRPDSDPDELADLGELDLPQQLSVSAGVAAARLYLDSGRPYKAYRELKQLETSYPRHHGRSQAGDILLEAGLQLARSGGGWWLWSERDDGIEVLEYLVLTYPSERRCDQAFAELAKMYEQDREYDLAIQRHEELLFSHVNSPLVVASQARIPHLRLLGVESPEYDRKELLRARSEIEAWLAAHAGDKLEDEVRLDYADCLHRLTQNDLVIARFYARVSQPYGARYHADRAARVARESGDPDLIRETERLLASLPEVEELPGRVRGVGDEAFAHDSTDVRAALQEQGPPTPEPDAPPKDGQP